MAGFGRFETVEELARSGPYSLFTGRLAGEQEIRFAIKTLNASAYLGDDEAFGRDAAVFLEAAALQKLLGAKEDSHWAPVHEQGKTDEAAYYVNDFYPRSVRRLIESKRTLTGPELIWLLTGVADGLLERRDGPGEGLRAHGRLDAGKVLIAGKGELIESGVVLTDPAAPSQLSADASGADRHALGAIIYELVLHRAAPRGGSVPQGAEWAALGGVGEHVRGLCERLLNPAAEGAPMSLEDIKAALAHKPVEPSKRGWMKWAAVAALLAAGGGGYAYYVTKNAPATVTVADARLSSPLVTDLLTELDGLHQALVAVSKDAARSEADTEALRAVGEELSQARREWDGIRREPAPRDEAENKEMEGKVLAMRAKVSGAKTAASGLESAWTTKDRIKKGETVSAEEILGLVKQTRPGLSTLRVRLADKAAEFQAAGGDVLALFQTALTPLEEAVAVLTKAAADAGASGADLGEIGRRVRQVSESSDKLKADATRATGALVPAFEKFIGEAESRSGSFAAGALREAWDRAVDRVKRAGTWVGAKEALASAEGSLSVIAGAFPAVEIAAGEVPDGADAGAIAAFCEAERVKSVVSVLGDPDKLPEPTDPRFVDRVREGKGKFEGFVIGARALLADAKRAAALQALGFGSSEVPEAGDKRTLATLAAGVAASPAKDLPRVGELFVPAVASLAALERSKDAAELLAALGGATPSRAVGAWRALAGLEWPGTLAELGSAGDALGEKVLPAIAKVSDGARRQKLEADAKAALGRMWLAFVRDKSGGKAADVEGAFGLLPAWKQARLAEIDPSAPEMDAWLRYDFARLAFKVQAKAIQAPDARAEGQAIQELVKKFKEEIKAKGLEAQLARESADFRTRLDRFEAGNVRDLKTSGPARAGATGWKWEDEDKSDEGNWVVYSSLNPAAQFPRVEFVKVKEDTASGLSSYVCTVETPLALVLDLAATRWQDTIKLMGNVDSNAIGLLRGVRAWDLSGARDARKFILRKANAQNGNGWLAAYENIGIIPANLVQVVTYYPGNMAVAAPTLTTPMQFVTPQAAAYLAAAMGCRLPSSEEWKAALGGGPIAGNRSDELLAKQLEHVKNQEVERGLKMQAADKPTKVDDGVFWGTDAGARPSLQAWGAAVPNQSDGFLWFAPVDKPVGGAAAPHSFVHLVGNVGEFVFEKPQELDAAPGTADGMDKFIRDNAGQVRVIGGSAISDAGLDPKVAYTVGTMRAGTTRWYADVGFRLAFTARSGAGGAASLVKMLDEAAYLTAGK